MVKILRISISALVIFLTLVFYGLFLNLDLKKYVYNFTSYINLGDVYVDSEVLPGDFLILENSEGYDGQFYYRLALDPFTKEPNVLGIRLDDPAYRQQRILYPFLAWIVTFGKTKFLPHVLITINLFFLALIAYFGTKLVNIFGFPKIFGLIFPLYPGFLFSFSRNLPEILEIALVLCGILAIERKKYFTASVVLSLAVLTKETALIIPLGLLVYNIFLRFLDGKKEYLKVVVLPIITYLVVRVWMYIVWSNLGMELSIHTGIIFFGFSNFLLSLFPPVTHLQKVNLLELLFILFFCSIVFYSISDHILSLVRIFNSQVIRYLKSYRSNSTQAFAGLLSYVFKKLRGAEYILIWLSFFLLSISLSNFIWREDYSYMRVLSELFIIGFIVLLKLNSKLFYFVCFMNIFLWFYLARDIISLR